MNRRFLPGDGSDPAEARVFVKQPQNGGLPAVCPGRHQALEHCLSTPAGRDKAGNEGAGRPQRLAPILPQASHDASINSRNTQDAVSYLNAGQGC